MDKRWYRSFFFLVNVSGGIIRLYTTSIQWYTFLQLNTQNYISTQIKAQDLTSTPNTTCVPSHSLPLSSFPGHSFLKSNNIYQVHMLWIYCKMNYYSMYSILSEIPLSVKLVRVTYICKWTSWPSANSQSAVSFIEWSIPKLISPFYWWLTDV